MIYLLRFSPAGLIPGMLVALALMLSGLATAYADNDLLDCSRRSLADAVRDAGTEITRFALPASARADRHSSDGLTLKGVGSAVIDGGGRDAVTVAGASRVALNNIEVRNGLNGIVAVNGAHLTLTDVNVHDNAVFGISLQTASSAVSPM